MERMEWKEGIKMKKEERRIIMGKEIKNRVEKERKK